MGAPEDARAAELMQAYEARIAALERLVGKRALELALLKGGSAARTPAARRAHVRDHRPRGLSVAKGCRLMGIARATFHDAPMMVVDDTALALAMHAIEDPFEAYGWPFSWALTRSALLERDMQAALGQLGWVVNHKKIKRLMREHGLQPP